jgi:hypothetical protein
VKDANRFNAAKVSQTSRSSGIDQYLTALDTLKNGTVGLQLAIETNKLANFKHDATYTISSI